MTPQVVDEITLAPRELRRKRLERVAFGLNGAIFLINAWDGLDSGGSRLGVAANLLLGMVQLAALLRSRSGRIPERLAYSLAAVGMLVSSGLTVHHRSGIAVAYALASAFNVALAVWGPERLRVWARRRPSPLPPSPGKEGES